MCSVSSLRSVVLLAAVVSLPNACAYDWTVGTVGVATDAGASDSTIADSEGSDSPATDSTAAVDTTTPPDCTKLRAALDAARTASKRCDAKPSSCLTTVKNECDCDSTIGEASKPESAAFVAAVKAYRDAGCSGTCGTACAAATTGLCIVDDAGGTSCSGP